MKVNRRKEIIKTKVSLKNETVKKMSETKAGSLRLINVSITHTDEEQRRHKLSIQV